MDGRPHSELIWAEAVARRVMMMVDFIVFMLGMCFAKSDVIVR